MNIICCYGGCRDPSPDRISDEIITKQPITSSQPKHSLTLDSNITLDTALKSCNSITLEALTYKDPIQFTYLPRSEHLMLENTAFHLPPNTLENLLYDVNSEVNYERMTSFLKSNDTYVSYKLSVDSDFDKNFQLEPAEISNLPEDLTEICNLQEEPAEINILQEDPTVYTDNNEPLKIEGLANNVEDTAINNHFEKKTSEISNGKSGTNSNDCDKFLRIHSLHKVHTGGYIINRYVNINHRNWNCVTGKKTELFCEVCEMDISICYKLQHAYNVVHMKKLQLCSPLKQFGFDLVRQLKVDRYHCAICNRVFNETCIRSHLTSEEHRLKFGNALKTAANLLRDGNTKLITLDVHTHRLTYSGQNCTYSSSTSSKDITTTLQTTSRSQCTISSAVNTQSTVPSISKTQSTFPFASNTQSVVSSTTNLQSAVSAAVQTRQTTSISKTQSLVPPTTKTQFIVPTASITQSVVPSTSETKYKQEAENSTDAFFEIESLERVQTSGYIINKQVHVFQRNWNSMTGTTSSFYCELCRDGNIDPMNRNYHFATKQHLENINECRPLKEFGLSLVRRVNDKRYHCAVCNDVFTESYIRSHVASEEHRVKFEKAKKTASVILDDKKSNLIKVEIPLATLTDKLKEAPKRDFSLLKVKNGGFIVNRKLCIGVRHWNATTGSSTAFYCSICMKALGTDYCSHNKSDEHKGMMAKRTFVGRFEMNLIRKMSTGVYHCAVCNVICNIPTQHIATSAHREETRRAEDAAREALKDENNYYKYYIEP